MCGPPEVRLTWLRADCRLLQTKLDSDLYLVDIVLDIGRTVYGVLSKCSNFANLVVPDQWVVDAWTASGCPARLAAQLRRCLLEPFRWWPTCHGVVYARTALVY